MLKTLKNNSLIKKSVIFCWYIDLYEKEINKESEMGKKLLNKLENIKKYYYEDSKNKMNGEFDVVLEFKD